MSIQEDKKALKNMTEEQRFKLFPIFLKDYNPCYKQRFLKEEILIKKALKDFEIKEIYHIGSTAIPFIKSKPIIDMILPFKKGFDVIKMEQMLELIGYMNCHKKDGLMFVKGYTKKGYAGQAFHLHVKQELEQNVEFDEVKFKNHLNNNKSDALQYEKLKLKLAKNHEFDRDEYTNQKTNFIKEIMSKI